MGMLQRCETTLPAIGSRSRPGRYHVDHPVAMIEKILAASTVGFDLAAIFV